MRSVLFYVVACLLFLTCLCLPSTLVSSSVFSPNLLIYTPLGPIQGEVASGLNVTTFTNIPFGLPPTGTLRWKSPVPITQPWSTPYQAVTSAFVGQSIGLCVQLNSSNGATGSEDCLYLNVTVPLTPPSGAPPKLPVVVYIFGGGFQSTYVESLSHIVSRTQSVIYVQINYRVGVFGFYAHPGLSSERAPRLSSGGYGFEDQQLALKWVQANIASFGGDPDSVTIQGFSAGAISTCAHLVAPGSRGLFHRVIAESGACDTPAFTLEQGEAIGQTLAEQDPGCSLAFTKSSTAQILCLRGKTASELTLLAQSLNFLGYFGPGIHPIVDGYFLPDTPYTLFNEGAFENVPILAGTTRGEMLIFLVERPDLAPDSTWITMTLPDIELNVRRLASNSSLFIQNSAVNFFTKVAPTNPLLAPMPSPYAPAYISLFTFVLSSFYFQCPQRRMLSALSTIGQQNNLYMYNWGFSAAVDAAKGLTTGTHGSHTAFVYDTTDLLTPSFTPAELLYAAKVQTLWLRFIYSGNPNTPNIVTDTAIGADMTGVPVWPNYTPVFVDASGAPSGDQYMSFYGPSGAAPFVIEPRLHENECGVWDKAYVNPSIVPRYQSCPSNLVPNVIQTQCVQQLVSTTNGAVAAVVQGGYAVMMAVMVAGVALML